MLQQAERKGNVETEAGKDEKGNCKGKYLKKIIINEGKDTP